MCSCVYKYICVTDDYIYSVKCVESPPVMFTINKQKDVGGGVVV